MEDRIVVTTAPIDVGALLADFAGLPLSGDARAPGAATLDGDAGAFVMFTGNVRRLEGNATIPALHYEHYSGMAEVEMQRLVTRARQQWPLRRVALVHRVGEVLVAEPSVVVVVSAGHRAEAFEAARFLIDQLKLSVPIWKRPA